MNKDENFLKSILDTIHIIIYIFDVRTNSIVYANSQVEKQLGYTFEELSAMKEGFANNFFHPDDIPKLFADTEELIRFSDKKYVTNDFRVRSKSGEFLWFNCHTTIHETDENGQPRLLLGNAKQITEARQTEILLQQEKQKKQEQENRYKTLTENSPLPILIYNSDADCVFANQAAAELLGGTVENLCKQNYKTLNTWTESGLRDAAQTCIETNEIVRKEIHTESSFGKEIWVQAHFLSLPDINDTQLMLTLTDIKQRKFAKLELERKNSELEQKNIELQNAIRQAHEISARYKVLHNASSGGIGIHDNGIILDCNQGLSDMTGYSMQELIGMNGLLLIAEDQREFFMAQILSGNEKPYESVGLRKNKTRFALFIEGRNVPFNGKIVRSVEFRDITMQKEAEQEFLSAKKIVEEREQFFSGIYENLPLMVFLKHAKDLSFARFNKAGEELLGYSRSELIGKTDFDFFPKEQADFFTANDREVLKNKGTIVIQEEKINTKQGLKILYTRKIAIQDSNGESKFLLGISEDITEKKAIEQALIESKNQAEQSKANLQAIIENTTDSIWAVGLDYRLTYLNNVFKKEFQLSFGVELKIGSHVIDSLPEILRPLSRARYDRVFAGERFETEDSIEISPNQFQHIRVSLNPIKAGNKIIGAAFFGSDITARKHEEKEIIKAKERAEENEERLRLSMKAAKQALYDIDIPSDTTKTNDTYATMLGFDPATFIETTEFWNDRLHPNDKAQVRQAYDDYISGKTPEYRIEFQSRTADNQWKWILSLGKIVSYNKAGKPIRMLGTHTDITKLKQTEHQLIVAKEKAEEGDRLKTAFLQNMSHEIRTPLNAICGFTGFLSNKNLSEEKRANFVSIIQNSSSQLLGIVTDILTISAIETKQEKINLENVSVNDLLSELVIIFNQNAMRKNIAFYTKRQLNDRESHILTDKTKLTQILTNLLTNAFKFTEKGKVEIGYSLALNHINSEMLEFYVKDTGIGIDKQNHEKIFERFRKADKTIQSNYGGTGLGLSISKGFVELLGGNMHVESELGQGTTFYFTLPYNKAEIASATDKTHDPIRQHATILVAEDEKINFLYIQEILSKYQLNLVHATTGTQAVEEVRKNPNIDLILMDIKMPEMNGFEAAKLIKEICPTMPIIATSAYTLDHEREAYGKTFDDYITKPIKENTLRERVMQYIEFGSETIL